MKGANLIGQKFNRLTVISFVSSNKGQRTWKCLCECGNTINASSHSLVSNNTKSCGCLQKEKAASTGKASATTHGLSKEVSGKKTRLFRIWTGIKTRCFNQNVREYKTYGGRGITICEQWLDFKVFHDWAVSNGYAENLTIERKDNNGNYTPGNCSWILRAKQAYNRSSTRNIEYNGETMPMSLMAKKYNISTGLLYGRLKRGWSIEKALTAPIQKGHNSLNTSN